MIGVVLAAGMASRLRPLTNDRPKCLLTVGSRTLLQRTFDALIAAGIKEFVVVAISSISSMPTQISLSTSCIMRIIKTTIISSHFG